MILLKVITKSKGKNSNYNSIVLNYIKELVSFTINCKFLAASYFQYTNKLGLKEKQERLMK
ncbi:12467_t:CDS:2 [Dentiscutata heterogama]|uniref:12467_t:CDS:1 n=1 Tax=Dentiscutata heterogama TaxID=1316150 RepID=A0ACA9KNE2_9GLOM|nr:12467_t:CDS:2 [Dentiscutata heterogama]